MLQNLSNGIRNIAIPVEEIMPIIADTKLLLSLIYEIAYL